MNDLVRGREEATLQVLPILEIFTVQSLLFSTTISILLYLMKVSRFESWDRILSAFIIRQGACPPTYWDLNEYFLLKKAYYLILYFTNTITSLYFSFHITSPSWCLHPWRQISVHVASSEEEPKKKNYAKVLEKRSLT